MRWSSQSMVLPPMAHIWSWQAVTAKPARGPPGMGASADQVCSSKSSISKLSREVK